MLLVAKLDQSKMLLEGVLPAFRNQGIKCSILFVTLSKANFERQSSLPPDVDIKYCSLAMETTSFDMGSFLA